jgi:signal transduction histidine kinase
LNDGSRSILSRIAWLHVAALAVAAIAMPLSSYLLLNNAATAFEDRILRAHAAELTHYLKVESGRVELRLPPDLDMFYAQGFDGFSFAIHDADGRAVAASQRHPILHKTRYDPAPQFFERVRGSTIYYGATIPERVGGRTVSVDIGQDGAHPDVIVDDIVADFLRRVGWFTIPILVVVFAIDVIVIRQALSPIRQASAEARAIDPQRIDLRLTTRDLPSEIFPLVDAFNKALDRLELGFKVQREFTADAAHELRTPLAVLRARIDAFPDQSLVTQLRRDIEVMSRIVGQLLEVAELETVSEMPDELIDLRSACAQVVDHIAPVVEAAGQRVVMTGTAKPVLIKGDPDLIFRAVRNLVENAAKYSPPASKIEVRIGDEGSVSVIDEGPGVPSEERGQIFRRFWRRERSRMNGAGLGLSIVSKIVEVHRGNIDVQNIAGGGAMFTLRFPRAAADLDSQELPDT